MEPGFSLQLSGQLVESKEAHGNAGPKGRSTDSSAPQELGDDISLSPGIPCQPGLFSFLSQSPAPQGWAALELRSCSVNWRISELGPEEKDFGLSDLK